MDKELIIVLVLLASIFVIIWLLVSLADRKAKKRLEENI